MKVVLKAYAKINLLLDIVASRTDGAHDLFTIMQSVGVFDTVSVEKKKSGGITISCNIQGIPTDARNIAYRAAETFFNANSIKDTSVHIDIVKRIPHAAGLAGGSADGAAVLVALNKIYKTELNDKQLCDIGVIVGADLPFCIVGGTKLSQGIGDILNTVRPLRRCHILLAKPDFAVNTGYAYSQFNKYGKSHTPDKLGMLYAMQSRDLYSICSKMENVFEQFIAVPNRIEIKEVMRNNNALGVCMSGSGPTIFGMFTDKSDAQHAASEVKAYAKDVLVCTPVSCGSKIIEIIE